MKRTVYTPVKGADFTNEPALVDNDRAPICENIIPDRTGYPEKRPGWRTLREYEGKIYGLHKYTVGGVTKMLIHEGTRLWLEDTLVCEDMAENVSRSYQNGEEVIILDGDNYRVYKNGIKTIGGNDTVNNVKSGDLYTDNGAYIPTTTISNVALLSTSFDEEYASANGVAYEGVNKLSVWRRMTATAEFDADNHRYLTLDDEALCEFGDEVTLGGGEGVWNLCTTVKVFVAARPYKVIYRPDRYSFRTRDQGVHINKDYVSLFFTGEGKTVLFLPFNLDTTPSVVGRDNIEIYYKAKADADCDITKCTVISEYDNSLFVTGNPDKPNFDWRSFAENPYYFPDLNYQKFGDNTQVLGYVNTGEYQAVIKKDGAAGGCIYIRSVSQFDGEKVYSVKQMASGIGGASKDGFCSLMGDDLVLTKQGIFAITSIDMTGERTLSNRSWYVDKKLVREDLSKAVMFVWQGKCMCAVGDRVYILNAEGSMSKNHKNNLLYDCYFWTGIPIERALVTDDALYFASGCKVYRLNTDLNEKERYNDDGEAIVARWGTKLDDDGDITRYKTMIKKGNTVTVKPFSRSSAKVYVRTENDAKKLVKYGTADIFDWEDIDFSRFTFLTSKTLREIIINSKVKKYKRLQFIVENDAINEGFGIIGISKHFALGNFIKR